MNVQTRMNLKIRILGDSDQGATRIMESPIRRTRLSLCGWHDEEAAYAGRGIRHALGVKIEKRREQATRQAGAQGRNTRQEHKAETKGENTKGKNTEGKATYASGIGNDPSPRCNATGSSSFQGMLVIMTLGAKLMANLKKTLDELQISLLSSLK